MLSHKRFLLLAPGAKKDVKSLKPRVLDRCLYGTLSHYLSARQDKFVSSQIPIIGKFQVVSTTFKRVSFYSIAFNFCYINLF